MALSQDLITQFAKLTVEPKDTNKAEIVKGTYKKVGDTEYVQIDGSEIWTPVKSTVNATAGDKVKVEIKNHIATITGNISNPSASSREVDTLADTVDEHGNTIKQMNNTITQQGSSILTIDSTLNQVESTVNEYKAIVDIQETAIQAHDSAIRANTANIAINSSDIRSQGDDISSLNTTVRSQNTTINTMNDNIRSQGNQITAINNTVEAHGSRISTAEDNIVSQGNDIEVIDNKVIAQGNTINTLNSEVAVHNSAIIANSSAINVNSSDIQILNTGFKIEDGVLTGLSGAVINELETDHLDARYATFDGLDANYAKIDFANIGIAAVEKVFADSGIIKDLVVQDQHITGELVGVTLKGDLIDGNTIKADKLVVKGSDGLYYKLNIDGLNNITTETAYRYDELLTVPNDWETNYTSYFKVYQNSHVPVSLDDLYELTESEPLDWSTNYTAYYTKSGNIYSHVTGATAPTWQSNTYYKDMYSLTTEEPSDWSETYSTYYTLSGNTYTRVPKGQSVPTWTANTYYKINWKLKSFYDKVYSKFDLTTSEPSDWSDNYKEYYI